MKRTTDAPAKRYCLAPPRGQVAALLVLLMAVVLVFVMVTANVGRVSVATTEVANAADAAGLLLGSHLASATHELGRHLAEQQRKVDYDKWKEMGSPDFMARVCVRTGWLWIGLATIAAVLVMVFVRSPQLATKIFLAGLAASAGALLGGKATYGEWSLSIALMGFAMGAAMAAGGHYMGKWLGQAFGTVGADLGATVGEFTGLAAEVVPSATAQAFGVGLGVAIGTGGNITYALAREDKFSVLGAEIARAISGLPAYERLREVVFFQALSKVVDDPNKTRGPANATGDCYWPNPVGAVGDPYDADRDGDTAESIPCFRYWWDVRQAKLRAALKPGQAEQLVQGFLNSLEGLQGSMTQLLALLEREEVECERGSCRRPLPPNDYPKAAPTEGSAIQLWRRVGVGPEQPPFWEPGPSDSALVAWLNDGCGDWRRAAQCPTPPAGIDSVDAARMHLELLLDDIDALQADIRQIMQNQSVDFFTDARDPWVAEIIDRIENDPLSARLQQLAATFDEWITNWYATPGSADYDHTWHRQLSAIATGDGQSLVGMRDWLQRTLVAAEALPGCNAAYDRFITVNSQPTRPPICSNDPPIYDCQWLDPEGNLAIGQRSQSTGLHFRDGAFHDPTDPQYFPGPTCQVFSQEWAGPFPKPPRWTGGHNQVLLKELRDLDKMVTDLWQTIPGDHLWCDPSEQQGVAPASLCQHDPACGATFDCQQTMTLVSIDEVCLDKVTQPGTDLLAYTFTYEFECNEGRSDPSTGTCTYTKVKHQATAKRSKPAKAPHLHIICQDYEGFLQALQEMSAGLQPLDSTFATIDADTGDELTPVLRGLSSAAQALEAFVNQTLPEFDRQMRIVRQSTPFAKHGGLPNPDQVIDGRPIDGLYTWKDTAGQHTVEVKLGPFILPEVKEVTHGHWSKPIRKKCHEIFDGCDNVPFEINFRSCLARRTWVEVSRTDPPGAGGGSVFWQWNPFGGRTSRKIHVQYTNEHVALCGQGGVRNPALAVTAHQCP